MWKKNVGLFVVALGVILTGCQKEQKVMGPPLGRNGEVGTPAPKNPAGVPAVPSRRVVSRVELGADFMNEMGREEYTMISEETACALWVEITVPGKGAEDFLELINSGNCLSASNTTFTEAEVQRRLTMQRTDFVLYELYAAGFSKAVGEMELKAQPTLTKLCTGSYQYERSGGVCIQAADEDGRGQFGELWTWN